MSGFRRAIGLVAMATLAVAGACDVDPVHNGEVAALGPEPNGSSPGPDHRPGQPCLVCHGGEGPAGTQFSLAGTVYQGQTGALVPQSGAVIAVNDATGSKATATTNAAGNFFILESQWAPVFPVHVNSVTYNDVNPGMISHIGRDGSCASCHSDPAGGDLVGHIYLAPGDEPDGGYPDGGP